MSHDYDHRDIAVHYPLAQELRLPLVSSFYPDWRYITAVSVASDEYVRAWNTVMPTDDELRAIACFHDEYCTRWYLDSYRERMRERPYDLDGGANGVVFGKSPDGTWKYRKFTWEHGPWPCYSMPQCSLVELMDCIHSWSGKPTEAWLSWKADHAEVFAAVQAVAS